MLCTVVQYEVTILKRKPFGKRMGMIITAEGKPSDSIKSQP